MCRSSSARRRRRLGLSCNATPWQTLIWRDIFPFYGSRYFTQIYIFVFYWIYLAKQYCAWKWTRVLWAILPLCSLFLSLSVSLWCVLRGVPMHYAVFFFAYCAWRSGMLNVPFCSHAVLLPPHPIHHTHVHSNIGDFGKKIGIEIAECSCNMFFCSCHHCRS